MEHEQLIGLPVRTQSGDEVGKVEGFIIQLDGQHIHQYQVKPYGLVHLFDTELLVHRDSVLSITEKEMIVEDAVSSQQAEKKTLPKKVPLSTEPITSKH